MKLLNIAALSLATALVLSSSLLISKETDMEAAPGNLWHTVPWGAESFDEVLWLAVDEVAAMEDVMAPEVETIHLELHRSGDNAEEVQLVFDRAALIMLKAGELAPEMFVRDYVEFN